MIAGLSRPSQGSAGVVMIAVTALSVALCASLVAGISALTQVAMAQSLTDAMALEAADMSSGRLPGYPCHGMAERLIPQHLTLVSCHFDDGDARVVTQLSWGHISLLIRSHAGPPRR